jgi:predicted nucleic acid-binding protein
MRAYIDSDVLIWHLRGERKALDFLRELRDLRHQDEYEFWTGAMQRAEVVFFMKPKEEEATMLFLSGFRTRGLDQETVDEAGRLYRRWNPSHGIDVDDALLAASVKRTGGRIFTLNVQHYPMPDVMVTKAW